MVNRYFLSVLDDGASQIDDNFSCLRFTETTNDVYAADSDALVAIGPTVNYRFDMSNPEPGSSVGVKLRNDSGSLVFFSGHRYARVVRHVDDSSGTYSGSSVSVPAGRTYAGSILIYPRQVVQETRKSENSPPQSVTDQDPSQPQLYNYRRRLRIGKVIATSTQISFGWYEGTFSDWSNDVQAVPAVPSSQWRLVAAILDVTNYG